MFGSHQVGEEDHELERIRKLRVSRLDAVLDMSPQGYGFLHGQIDDPAVRPLVLRPRLDLPIAIVVEGGVLGVQLEAVEPLFQ